MATEEASDLLGAVEQARVRPGEIALWYTGGAGYILRTVAATIFIDPFVGPSDPPDWVRAIPPPFDPAAVRQIDAVLMTHEHIDHADPHALGPLGQNTRARAIGSEACIAIARVADYPAERTEILGHGASTTVGDVQITAVPMDDPGAKACNGYILEAAGQTILHGGDSLYFSGFAEIGKQWSVDAICLSVGVNPPGITYYMDEVDAARAARDVGARTLIPQHYDLWKGLTLDPQRVAVAASWYCPQTQVTPAQFGKRITLTKQLI